MTTAEHIENARECASDAIVLLDAAEKATDQHLTAELLTRAGSLLKVGSDEALYAARELKKEIEAT